MILADGGTGAPGPRASHSLSSRSLKPVSSDQLSQSKVVKMWCGARVGGALCYITNPTLRLKNQRVFTFGALGAS